MRNIKRLHNIKSTKIWDQNSGFDSPGTVTIQHKRQDAAFKAAMMAAHKEISVGVSKSEFKNYRPRTFMPCVGSQVGSPAFLCSEE